jgi:hypothetical protein
VRGWGRLRTSMPVSKHLSPNCLAQRLTPQNIRSMADGKLSFACDIHSNVTRYCVVWMQSSLRYLRTLHGNRSNVWAHDRHHCEGPLSVRSSCIFVEATISTF